MLNRTVHADCNWRFIQSYLSCHHPITGELDVAGCFNWSCGLMPLWQELPNFVQKSLGLFTLYCWKWLSQYTRVALLRLKFSTFNNVPVVEKFMYSSEHLAKNCEKLNFLPRTEGHDFVLVFVKSSSLQNTDPSYSKTEFLTQNWRSQFCFGFCNEEKWVPHCKTLTPVIQKLNVQNYI